MAQLLDLPNELLSVIASLLSASDTKSHQAALASLCLSCWRLNEIAQEKLYTNPRLFLLRGWDPLHQWWTFARTAVEIPILASKVRRLALDASAFADVGCVSHIWFDMSRLGAAGSRHGIPDSRFYVPRFARLLVTLANKAKTLQLHLTTQAHQDIFDIFTVDEDLFQRLSPTMGGLTEIDISPIEGQHAHNPTIFKRPNVFSSPGLQKLHLEQAAFVHFRNFFYLPIKGHNLVELHLHQCYIPFKILRPWIEGCAQLKVFSFSSLNTDGGTELYEHCTSHWVRQLTPRQLFPALQACASTLERLDVDFSDAWDWDLAGTLYGPHVTLEEPDDHYIYPSFQTFKQLRHLRIEIAHVSGAIDLPSSLETLTLITKEISNVSEHDIYVLSLELMDPVHAQCANLKWIHVEEMDLSEVEIESALTKLQWLDEERHAKGRPPRSFEFRLLAKGGALWTI